MLQFAWGWGRYYGLLLATQTTAARAGLGLPLGWLLAHGVTAGALVGWLVLLQRRGRVSWPMLIGGQFIASLILAVGQYLLLRPYLSDTDAPVWGTTTLVSGLLLPITTILGLGFGDTVGGGAIMLVPKRWPAVRVGIVRGISAIFTAILVGTALGTSQRALLQDQHLNADAWVLAAVVGCLVSLVGAWVWVTFLGRTARGAPAYLIDPRLQDDGAGIGAMAPTAARHRLAFRVLALEAIMLLGMGVATGVMLFQWFG